jgi:Type I phosphodiesterase / nucleotide pyrophosphatase
VATMIPPGRVVLVGVAALGLAIAGHWHIHLGYMDRINTMRTPPDPPRRIEAAAAASATPAARLHVVLIDGLGYEQAMSLPAVRALASDGVSRVLMADFPSFTDPGMRAMVTGRPPLWSGVRINGAPPYAAWDTVTRRAEESGFAVRSGGEEYQHLHAVLDLSPETTFASPTVLLAPPWPPRVLDFFYFGLVDDVGHEHGAASPEYHAAAIEADAFLANVSARVDRETDAIFVLSDHGQMPEGGHGGAEPEARRAVFVAAGRGVAKAGALPPAAMRDVASTIAAVLAIPPPKDSIGEPMLDALAGADGKALAAPRDDVRAREEDAIVARDFEARARTRIERTAVAALFVLGIAAWLARALGLRLRPRDARPALVHAFVFASAYALMGYRISWSIKRSELVFEVHTLLFGVMAALAAMKVGSRERRVEEALVTTALYGVAIALDVAWLGLDTRWLAGPGASFFLFVLVTCHFYLGIASAFAVFRTRLSPSRFTGAIVATVGLVLAPVAYRLLK